MLSAILFLLYGPWIKSSGGNFKAGFNTDTANAELYRLQNSRFFLKVSKEIGKAWRKSLKREPREPLTPVKRVKREKKKF